MEWKHHRLSRDKLTLPIHKVVPLQAVSRLVKQLRACSQGCNRSPAPLHSTSSLLPPPICSCAEELITSLKIILQSSPDKYTSCWLHVRQCRYRRIRNVGIHACRRQRRPRRLDDDMGILSPRVFSCTDQVRSHQELPLLKHSSELWKWKPQQGANENAFSDPANQSLPLEGHLGVKLLVHLMHGWVPGMSHLTLSHGREKGVISLHTP